MNLSDTCILESRTGKKFLFSRFINFEMTAAQVHDGTSILATLNSNLMGKRRQNWIVTTYEPQTSRHQRRVGTVTYHHTKEAAIKKMERRAIQQFKDRHEAAERTALAERQGDPAL